MAASGYEPGALFMQFSASNAWPVMVAAPADAPSQKVGAHSVLVRRLGYAAGEKGEFRAEPILSLSPWGAITDADYGTLQNSFRGVAMQGRKARDKLEAALRLATALEAVEPSERPAALARFRAEPSSVPQVPASIEAYLDAVRPGGSSDGVEAVSAAAPATASGRPRRQAAAKGSSSDSSDADEEPRRAGAAAASDDEAGARARSGSRGATAGGAKGGAGKATKTTTSGGAAAATAPEATPAAATVVVDASAATPAAASASSEWPPARLARGLVETPEYAARLHTLGWASFPSFPLWPVIIVPLENASPEALVSYDATATRDKTILLNLGRGQEYSVFPAGAIKPWAPGTPAHEAAVEAGQKLMATLEASGRTATDKRAGWREAYEEAVAQAAKPPSSRISVLASERRLAWNAWVAASEAAASSSRSGEAAATALTGKRPAEAASASVANEDDEEDDVPLAKRRKLDSEAAATATTAAPSTNGKEANLATATATAPTTALLTGSTDYLTRLLNKGLKRLNTALERKDVAGAEDTVRILGTIGVTAAALSIVPIIPAVRNVAKEAPRWSDRPAEATARLAEACNALLASWRTTVAADLAAKASAAASAAAAAQPAAAAVTAAPSAAAAAAASSGAGTSPTAAVIAPAKIASELLADYATVYGATGLDAEEADYRMVARRTCADAVAAAVFGGLMQRPGVATALGGGGPSSALLGFLMETLRGVSQVAALGLETACVTKTGPLLPALRAGGSRSSSSSSGGGAASSSGSETGCCVPGSETYTNRLTALVGLASTAFEDAATEAGRTKPVSVAADKLAARLEEGIGRARRAAASLTQRSAASSSSSGAVASAGVDGSSSSSGGTSFEDVAGPILTAAVPHLVEMARLLTPAVDARVEAWTRAAASLKP